MKLATYIDGNEHTTARELRERHSISCSVKIKQKHEAELKRIFLERGVCDQFSVPKHDDEPVPVVFSTAELSDIISDHEDDEWIQEYLSELKYMAEEDGSSMGIVYLMSDRA